MHYNATSWRGNYRVEVVNFDVNATFSVELVNYLGHVSVGILHDFMLIEFKAGQSWPSAVCFTGKSVSLNLSCLYHHVWKGDGGHLFNNSLLHKCGSTQGKYSNCMYCDHVTKCFVSKWAIQVVYVLVCSNRYLDDTFRDKAFQSHDHNAGGDHTYPVSNTPGFYI